MRQNHTPKPYARLNVNRWQKVNIKWLNIELTRGLLLWRKKLQCSLLCKTLLENIVGFCSSLQRHWVNSITEHISSLNKNRNLRVLRISRKLIHLHLQRLQYEMFHDFLLFCLCKPTYILNETTKYLRSKIEKPKRGDI